jgi:hypothetical protein
MIFPADAPRGRAQTHATTASAQGRPLWHTTTRDGGYDSVRSVTSWNGVRPGPPSVFPSALERTVAGARLVDPPRGALRNERDDIDDCIYAALVAHDVDVAAVVDKS